MIQRVNNQNFTNKYSQNTSKIRNTGEDTPAFLLGNEKEGVVWDRQEEKADRKSQKNQMQKNAKDNLPAKNSNSSGFVKAAAGHEGNQNKKYDTGKKTDDAAGIYQLKERIFGFTRTLIQKIAAFFWYGNDTEWKPDTKETPADMSIEKTENISAEQFENTKLKGENSKTTGTILSPQEKDARIRELLAKKDTEAVMDLLTEHHTKQLAKKSGLLTQYDRHGTIKMPGGSEQSRILADDKGMKM